LLPENSTYKQGDIWIADLGEALGHEQGGTRPVLIVSGTKWNAKSKTPMVCPCTTSLKKGKNYYCVKIKIGNKASYVNGSHVYTLSAKRFKTKVGTISISKRIQIANTIKKLLYVISDSTLNDSGKKKKQKQE